MAKTKAELQNELIKLRNENKRVTAALKEAVDRIKTLENSLRESNNTIIDLEEMNQGYKNRIEEVNKSYDELSNFNAELKIASDKQTEELNRFKVALKKRNKEVFAMTEDNKNLKRLQTAHIKLGEALREAKDQLKVQEEVTVEMVKQFDNVLMERHEKIKSLKSQNNNLRQTLKDTL